MKVCLAAPLINHPLLCTGGVNKSIENQQYKQIYYAFLMKIFLAGGISGNLREFWQNSRRYSQDQIMAAMKSFIAGKDDNKEMQDYIFGKDFFINGDNLRKINILESFYYLRSNDNFMPLIGQLGVFLLDSGAFTFMSGSHKGGVDWNKYVEEYAAFINKWNIDLFFELDIDSIVGIEKVERLRERLEALTGKKPIPVWHRSRGKEYFIQMCKNYPYVAVGGIVTKEIERKKYESAFPWFIQTAHANGCKIHGLGYTTLVNLKKYHFDSVDSTAWLYGNRGGYLYKFNPRTGLLEQIGKDGCRLKTREGAVNNFNEWVKFSKYADKNL